MRLRFLTAVTLSILAVSQSPAQVSQAAREPGKRVESVKAARIPAELQYSTRVEEVVPPSKRDSQAVPFPVPRLVLPALDTQTLLSEDARKVGLLMRMRVGVNRSLPGDFFDHGDRYISGDSNVWRLELETTGAQATRLHLPLVPGAKLYVTSAAGESKRYEVPEADPSFWTDPVPGDVVLVEIESDRKDDLPLRELLAHAEIVHFYNWDGLFGPSSPCNLDAMCYPDWINATNAVGRMTMSGGGGSFVCSGSLIATGNNDFSPLFLTANHCMETPVDPASVFIYWRYRNVSCNGGLSFNESTSGGAEIIGQTDVGDMALLRLKGVVPRTLLWLGWTLQPPAVGELFVTPSHPHGDPMKIAFGIVDAPIASEPDFHITHYLMGMGEPGSSGAPFINAAGMIQGTLTGGNASCSNPSGTVVYGKLESGINAFRNVLANGLPDDAYEPNNSLQTAATLATGTYNNLVLKTDEDWFRFTVPNGGSLRIDIPYQEKVGFEIYRSDGTLAPNSVPYGVFLATPSGGDEQFFLRARTSIGTRTLYSFSARIDTPAPIEVGAPVIGGTTYYFASLAASATVGNVPTTCWFEADEDPSLSNAKSFSAFVDAAGNRAWGGVSSTKPSTTYYVRAACKNILGTFRGATSSFTTAAVAPITNLTPQDGFVATNRYSLMLAWYYFQNVYDKIELYFGKHADPPWFSRPNGNAVYLGGSQPLDKGTTYYWKVVTTYSGQSASSPTYSFVTSAFDTSWQIPPNFDFGSTLAGTEGVIRDYLLRNEAGFFGGVGSAQVRAETSGDFELLNQCPPISYFSTCDIFIRFKPTSVGLRTGQLRLYEEGSPVRVYSLSGLGTDFNLRAARASRPSRIAQTAPGQTAEIEVQLDSGGVNLGEVEINCSGDGIICGIPHRVTASGAPVALTAIVSTLPAAPRARRLHNPKPETVRVQVSARKMGVTRSLTIPVTLQRQ